MEQRKRVGEEGRAVEQQTGGGRGDTRAPHCQGVPEESLRAGSLRAVQGPGTSAVHTMDLLQCE